MLTKSVFPLIALLTMTTPTWARQACTLSEVEQLVAQEKEALAVLKRHQTELLKIPHVTGLGIGTLQNDEQGIIILVDQCGPPADEGKWRSTAVPGEPCPNLSHELEWQVPDRLDGVPVEIREYIGPKMPVGIAIGEPSPEGWVLPGDPGYNPNAKYCMPTVPNGPPVSASDNAINKKIGAALSSPSFETTRSQWEARLGMKIVYMGAFIERPSTSLKFVIAVNAQGRPIPDVLPHEFMGLPVEVRDSPPITLL